MKIIIQPVGKGAALSDVIELISLGGRQFKVKGSQTIFSLSFLTPTEKKDLILFFNLIKNPHFPSVLNCN